MRDVKKQWFGGVVIFDDFISFESEQFCTVNTIFGIDGLK